MSYSSWVISLSGKKDPVFPKHKSELFGSIDASLVISPNPYPQKSHILPALKNLTYCLSASIAHALCT